MTTANPAAVQPRVAVLLEPSELDEALRHEARAGLTAQPKVLSPKWFYDELGSILFDAITRLPEYYPTRCERAILTERAGEIARSSGADTLVELGSGTSDKTRLLLDALAGAGTLARFAPFDVSEATLRSAALSICAAYPGVEVEAVVGDFERHLDLLPAGGRRVIAFLGGTIGNLERAGRATLLGTIAAGMEPGDTFLLGTDLVKDIRRLELAYDDPTGVTAAFNRNVLGVLNRRLGARFALRRFEHVARYDRVEERIEMLLRSHGDQRVAVDALGLDVDFADGEEMRTEISAKFRRRGVEEELGAAGLEVRGWWTDQAGDFALSLSSLA